MMLMTTGRMITFSGYSHVYFVIVASDVPTFKHRIIMNSSLNCPKCSSPYCYEDGLLYICPECSHEWPIAIDSPTEDIAAVIKDANGTPLHDGDAVTVIKDLKVKGTSLVVKVGTKVKNIRLVAGDHDIDCKIDGIGPMKLKSEFVKKI